MNSKQVMLEVLRWGGVALFGFLTLATIGAFVAWALNEESGPLGWIEWGSIWLVYGSIGLVFATLPFAAGFLLFTRQFANFLKLIAAIVAVVVWLYLGSLPALLGLFERLNSAGLSGMPNLVLEGACYVGALYFAGRLLKWMERRIDRLFAVSGGAVLVQSAK